MSRGFVAPAPEYLVVVVVVAAAVVVAVVASAESVFQLLALVVASAALAELPADYPQSFLAVSHWKRL